MCKANISFLSGYGRALELRVKVQKEVRFVFVFLIDSGGVLWWKVIDIDSFLAVETGSAEPC